jgi:hypothetical protein
MDLITFQEFKDSYLPNRISNEAESIAEWCRKKGVDYNYTINILNGYGNSVSDKFLLQIGCERKIQTP